MRMALVGLLLVGCGTSSGLEVHTYPGGPGQPISVGIASVDNSITIEDPDGSRQHTVQVEVSNVSDVVLTVTQISIRTEGSSAFQVYPTVQKLNEMIDPGKDHLFEVNVRGRFVRQFRPEESKTVDLLIIVSLSNGDSYSYTFEGPVRTTP